MISSSLNLSMKKWRQSLHQIPEFGFETFDTASFIVEKLKNFGITDRSSTKHMIKKFQRIC